MHTNVYAVYASDAYYLKHVKWLWLVQCVDKVHLVRASQVSGGYT